MSADSSVKNNKYRYSQIQFQSPPNDVKEIEKPILVDCVSELFKLSKLHYFAFWRSKNNDLGDDLLGPIYKF